jgi:signal transduction histidine kinase
MAAVINRREAEIEKLRLEDQLRHTERLATLGQLAAGLAHEINEPLSSAVGFAQLAGKCPGLPEQAGRDIDKVLYASLQAREIVKRLLTFTRQSPPRQRHVDLNRIVTEGLQLFESRCAKEGIELSCRLSSARTRVQGDPTQLTQVFINLMVNALHAMPSGGILKVRTTRKGNQALIVIEDTGMGMGPHVLKNILTPFFTTKDVNEGTGLGLPVADSIVRSHGGTLVITSKPGEGTKCVVKLPAAQPQKESWDENA